MRKNLLAHKDEIHQVMKSINPLIITLSETKLTEEIGDNEANVPGYSIDRCDAENRNTRGTALYIREDMKYEIVMVKKKESNCWCIVIEVKDKRYGDVIIVVYHSPSAAHGEFIRFVEEVVKESARRKD